MLLLPHPPLQAQQHRSPPLRLRRHSRLLRR
jgi:hypothetical protein